MRSALLGDLEKRISYRKIRNFQGSQEHYITDDNPIAYQKDVLWSIYLSIYVCVCER